MYAARRFCSDAMLWLLFSGIGSIPVMYEISDWALSNHEKVVLGLKSALTRWRDGDSANFVQTYVLWRQKLDGIVELFQAADLLNCSPLPTFC